MADGGGGGVAEGCVVCQCDVEGGEEVVELRGCGHSFHVGCIEPWLRGHDLCPTSGRSRRLICPLSMSVAWWMRAQLAER